MGYLLKHAPRLVIFLSLLAALYAIYQPATQGYYLYSDDYWTYLDRNKPISSNDAFRSQATYAARPIGALFDLTVFRTLRTISDANYARSFSILLLAIAGFLLYGIINKYGGFRRAEAFLITVTIFSLPSFQSGIVSLFEINSILAIIITTSSAALTIRYLEIIDRADQAAPILYIISACLLLIAALLTYTNGVTFYWAVLACYLLRVSPSVLHKNFRHYFIVFILPVVAMGIYYALYKALAAPSSSSYSLIAPSISAVFEKLPIVIDFLQVSLSFWFPPNINAGGELVNNKPAILISTGIILLGFAYGIKKDIELSGTHSGRTGLVSKKYLIIAVIVLVSVSPMLLSSIGASIQIRRLQALQTILLILLIWSANNLISHFLVKQEKTATTIFLIAICLIGSMKTNHDLKYIFIEPLSAELSYIKSEVKKGLSDPANNHIHILLPNRVSSRVDSIGFMATSRAWPPGMIVAVIGDLAAEDNSFVKHKETWSLGYAEDHVTNSLKEEVAKGLISFDRLNVITIDLSNIEHYIDPYIPAWESVKSGHHRGANIFTHQESTNGIEITWRAMEGLPISNGDYPGFKSLYAFDGDYSSSRWGSSQTGTNIRSNAWIGFDFGQGLDKHIRHVRIRQGGAIKSGTIQQSLDGAVWATVADVPLVNDKNIRIYHLPKSKPARFWRLLANDNLAPPSAWTVYEIQMVE